MDLSFTPEQIKFRDEVREWLQAAVPPHIKAKAAVDGAYDHDEQLEWHKILYKKGWIAAHWPKEFGGPGLDVAERFILSEEMELASVPTLSPFGLGMVGPLIIQFGSKAQKARFLPKILSGEEVWCQGYSEPNAGSDLASLEARAVRDGDDYVLDGSKRFISQGSVADLITVFAVTDPAGKRHRNLSCFVVEKGMPGFSIGRLEHKMGIRGSPTAELLFDGVRVPAANLVGAEGEGFRLAMRTFERSRPGIAAQAVGIAQGALDVAARYATERVQFGKPIGELQMIQGMLADMDAATEAARSLLYTACAAIEAGDGDAGRWAAVCKLVAGDAAMRVTTDAVQVLGGYGYVDDFPVERMMRDAKITQLYEGTQQIQRLVVARSLLAAQR
jgi:alkylation response protein AidB-like acyl-CoA dehydrogenase